ncbi:MAG: glycosyl transferase [Flavobacterium sp. BFFFF2]|nr:MAG: glycosyl transferase [Flavobacterium sp. BFFFF2]
MPKKISIITVCYNNREGLEKTFKSVLGQSYRDFDFLVIDGNSQDGSKEVMEQYRDKIDFALSEKDTGVFNAMNKGIKAATGDFVLFMNSGDIFADEHVLANVVDDLTNEFDIYYGNNYKVKSNGSKRLKTYPPALTFSFFYTTCINHQSTFIRRQLFHDYFMYNEQWKIVSDWEFFVYTICAKNVPYKYLNKTIAEYDFNGMSSDPKNQALIRKERLEVIHTHFPAFEKDYQEVARLNAKRTRQLFHIENFPIAWKIMKAVLTVFIFVLPKKK